VPAIQDRTCLHRIVNNLAGNAIKFTEHGEITVAIAADDDQFHLTVRDTGIGIASTFLPHLFDEFKQESTGLTRSHKGSGLGLAITRRLVDMMGGEIRVDSEKGNGTLFTVSAPLKAPGISATKTDDAMRPPTRPLSSPSPKSPDRQT
jgi:signal transduction histidine kinase